MSHCDESIGPRVDPSCRSFDFTLYFQDLFFSTTPNAILLVLLVLPVARLLRAQDIVRRTKSVAVKAVSKQAHPASSCSYTPRLIIFENPGSVCCAIYLSDNLSGPQMPAAAAAHPCLCRNRCARHRGHPRRRQPLMAPAPPLRAAIGTSRHLLCPHLPAQCRTR